MKVSVIIPCRNAASTVGQTIESVLAQTEPPHEILVVDDTSTDDSAAVARAAGAFVIQGNRRRNAGGARNAGIDVAAGDVLAFLDADAVASPAWLERVRMALEKSPEVVGVGGRIANGRPSLYGELDYFMVFSEFISPHASLKTNIPTMGIAYRRDAIGDIRFAETTLGEDTAFAVAVLRRGGKLWYDPGIVMTHYHERLDRKAYWERQVSCGKGIYYTRTLLDLPGKALVRHPILLAAMPHLWIVLGRMVRAGLALRALALLPWFVVGEVARIQGFLAARREGIPPSLVAEMTAEGRS